MKKIAFVSYAKKLSLKIQYFAHCAINGHMKNIQELGLARKKLNVFCR
jgi:hypothetical protein